MTLKIVSNREYVAGWLDSSVHDFLPAVAISDASIAYALVTCIDSNRNPASLLHSSPELKPLARRAQTLETGLLVPTERLLECDARRQLFFGFDEIWFFPANEIEPKPPAATIVGPTRIDRVRFKRLGKWMLDNSCSLAVGGGEGLNFVVRASGLARSVLGFSIEQPNPSSARFDLIGSS